MFFTKKETVLISGGSTGIGYATAKLFSSEGAAVIICGRNIERGKQAEKEINNSKFIQCDITQKKDIDRLFNRVITDFGRLDMAVNNAGISKGGKYIPEFTIEDFDEIVNTNVKGLFLCLQKEIEIMKKQGAGSIVNIASVLGVKAHQSKNALYTMTKHAVVGLTKEAALEYATEGIRINAVLPAYTETEIISHHLKETEKREKIEKMHPMNRLIQPDEVARAVFFLLSKNASAMTGTLLPVDGGCLAM